MSNGFITVSFNPPTNTGGSPITQYLAMALVNGEPTGISAVGTGSPIVINGLTNGVTYTAEVFAFNAAGESVASNQSNPVTPSTVPGAPTGLVAVAGNGTVTVSFTPPGDTGGAPITGYVAQASSGALNPTVATGTGSPITIPGLTNGTSYTVVVTAQNLNGAGPASAPSNSVTPTAPQVLPGPPTGVNAVGVQGGVQVYFNAPANNGGSVITDYVVTSTPGNVTATGPDSPVEVTGLVPGTVYSFTVLAVNQAGQGPASAPSNQASPLPVPTVPTQPLNPVATAGNGQILVSFSPPTSNGNDPILSYTATASTGQSASGTASPLTITGLTNGTPVTATVVATNGVGSGPASVPTNSVTPAAAPTVPTAPGTPTAVGGNAQGTVSFTPPASNGGSPITSYTAYASSGQSSSGTASPITVTGLANGTAVNFTVKATNAVGTGPASVPSNTVTPQAPSGFVITNTGLPGGTVGTGYSGQLVVSGGTPPITYSQAAGSALPASVYLNPSTGALYGTPTAAGTTTGKFYATDSSGTIGYPTSTTVCDNEGAGPQQEPGGIASTSSVPLVAGDLLVCFTTVATFGSGGPQGAHPARNLAATNGDSFTLQTYVAGPQNGSPGTPINASQETDMWTCTNPAGGVTTFHQWFGTAGFGGGNQGDNDYQAFVAFQYSAGATFLGYGAFTAQTGTGYAGVPQGTALKSGPITITAAQVPCRLYGFCENTSSLGTNYVPEPGNVAGSTGTVVSNFWGFGGGAAANTTCYAYWNINTPGTYQATFTNPSTSLNCFQTAGWAVRGAGAGGAVTPTVSLPITIASSGGGGGGGNTPGAPTALSVTPGVNSAVVLFAAPTNIGSSALTKFVSTASPAGSTAQVAAITSPVSGLSARILHTGLPAGVPQTFTVAAYNSSGAGASSAASAAVTPTAASNYYIACGPGTPGENSSWDDSYSYGITYAYQAAGSSFNGHTVPAPLTSGTQVVCVAATGYGGWLPHVKNAILSGTNGRFNLVPYSHFTFSIFPTAANYTVQTLFEASIWLNFVATGGSANTASSSLQNWPTNQFAGGNPWEFDNITAGVNETAITGNTATTVTFNQNGGATAAGHYCELQQPDVSYGIAVSSPNPYGPSPMVQNQWNTYSIPLTAFNLGGLQEMLKLSIQDQSGSATTFFLCNVGFTV